MAVVEAYRNGSLVYYKQDRLKELIAEVDALDEITPIDIAALANKYGESYEYIQIIVEAKEYRNAAKDRTVHRA